MYTVCIITLYFYFNYVSFICYEIWSWNACPVWSHPWSWCGIRLDSPNHFDQIPSTSTSYNMLQHIFWKLSKLWTSAFFVHFNEHVVKSSKNWSRSLEYRVRTDGVSQRLQNIRSFLHASWLVCHSILVGFTTSQTDWDAQWKMENMFEANKELCQKTVSSWTIHSFLQHFNQTSSNPMNLLVDWIPYHWWLYSKPDQPLFRRNRRPLQMVNEIEVHRTDHLFYQGMALQLQFCPVLKRKAWLGNQGFKKTYLAKIQYNIIWYIMIYNLFGYDMVCIPFVSYFTSHSNKHEPKMLSVNLVEDEAAACQDGRAGACKTTKQQADWMKMLGWKIGETNGKKTKKMKMLGWNKLIGDEKKGLAWFSLIYWMKIDNQFPNWFVQKAEAFAVGSLYFLWWPKKNGRLCFHSRG